MVRRVGDNQIAATIQPYCLVHLFMRNLNQNTITQAVLERIADTPNPRIKEIVTSLVTHLHDFARDVKLTEDEWMQGIQFLTKTGQMCNEKRQEFILLSDVLGLSMLTIALNHDKPAGCTEPTVFGPFFLEEAPQYELGADVANGAKGTPCLVSGRILSIFYYCCFDYGDDYDDDDS